MGDYNGWANRETWAAVLWIDNDQGTYGLRNEWLDAAARDGWRRVDHEQIVVDHLSDFLATMANDAPGWGLWADVVRGNGTLSQRRAAIERADLHEIAAAWWAEYVDENGHPDEDDEDVSGEGVAAMA